MDSFEAMKLTERAVVALEAIAIELEKLNKEGVVVFGGTTLEEN